ncbi:MAG: AAA family ATPase [Deltaproteobacteria bacterium]|nr:AAA family ATPase [Deltaproteobacteria bacterium]
MDCASCQFVNPDGMNFCGQCGTALRPCCPQCGFENPAGFGFCGKCGAALVLSAESRVLSPPQHLTPQPPSSYTPPHLAERIRAATVTEGERKTITALFADLKGSTALIEGLDPEEARAIIDPALQLMMDAVHSYDGYVAQALGDGIFALFGAPLAHEDHPQRALYAALRMQEAMRRHSDQVRLQYGVPLAMRVGLNTGEVVVRSIRKDDLHTDYVPVGHSTNLAARMEQMATPGSILITDYTRKLVEGYFALKALGAATIKGVETPLNIYEVLGAGPLKTRLQVAARRGLTRFVGRQSELEQLQQALAQAKAGHGQIVGVMGEPGLGKSRLFYEFKLLSVGGCLVLEAYSVSHGKATAYLPVIELLKSYFDIQAQDDERKRREKITGKVLTLDRSLEDTLPYLFALLGIEEQPSPLQQMDAQIRRRRTFEALKRLFLRESLNQPLILIFEDLHWIDGETQGFLDVLSESVASAKVLLLTNYRPEYRHEWGQKTYYTQLRLAPLGKAEAEEFLAVLLGDRSSPQPSPQRGEGDSPRPSGERARVRGMEDNFAILKQLILDKTQGTPFFMEEIVQELREQGVLPDVGARRAVPLPTDLHIPPTVQGILAARIDRLTPDEKALLQQLSVIGREFPLSLMKRVVSQPEDELHCLLASLQRKEFLYEQPAFPEVEYIFKHALTQEVAYGTVLQEQRKRLHERTAQALEALYAATLPEHYSDLAHHYRRSGNAEKAVGYLSLAGQQAVQRSAYAEAVNHLATALGLLKTLPDTQECVQQELPLQIALAHSRAITLSYTTPAVGQAFLRAHELCQQLGETPHLSVVLRGLWNFYGLQAKYETAREMVNRGLSLAQRLQDATLLMGAHQDLGFFSLWPGEWEAARKHLEQSLMFYDPRQHRSYLARYEADLGLWSLSEVAVVLWCLGYPEQALQKSREALRLAHELGHPYSTNWILICAAWLYQQRREPQEAQKQAEAAMTLSEEQGFRLWSVWGTALHGWARALQGQGEEGVAEIREGMRTARTMGELGQTYFLSLLAEGYSSIGQYEEGLLALTEALEFVEKTGERIYEAELYRIKGELTLQQAGSRLQAEGLREKTEEAEGCFLRAIEIAQKQQAKSLELRAVMSLARLWQSQGKHSEARQMLAEIYEWFTEGFDTKDLQEAQALLTELTG